MDTEGAESVQSNSQRILEMEDDLQRLASQIGNVEKLLLTVNNFQCTNVSMSYK